MYLEQENDNGNLKGKQKMLETLTSHWKINSHSCCLTGWSFPAFCALILEVELITSLLLGKSATH